MATGDKRITQLIRQNRQEGFDLLYETYAPAVYGFLNQQQLNDQAAELLLNQVFAEAYRKIREAEKEEVRLLLWLIAIAREQSTNAKRQGEALERLMGEVEKLGTESIDQFMEMNQAGKLLFDAIHLHGCSLQQLVETLGCSREQVGITIRKSLMSIYQTT